MLSTAVRDRFGDLVGFGDEVGEERSERGRIEPGGIQAGRLLARCCGVDRPSVVDDVGGEEVVEARV